MNMYTFLYSWFFSLNIISLTFLLVPPSFLLQMLRFHSSLWYNIVYIYIFYLSIYLLYNHLCCFYILSIVNSARINLKIQLSLWTNEFTFFVCINKCGTLDHSKGPFSLFFSLLPLQPLVLSSTFNFVSDIFVSAINIHKYMQTLDTFKF